MTPTGQDGRGLVGEKTLDDLLVGYYGGWNWVEEIGADEQGSPIRERFRAALAAVAPDIAAQARRECADELRAALDDLGRERTVTTPYLMRDLDHASKLGRLTTLGQLRSLADRWSDSPPAGG